MRIIIVGAGIGGLCAAIALRQAGHEVAIYEKTPEMREVGAGLSLWANALTALDRLGLGAAVAATGSPALSGAARDDRGRILTPIQAEAAGPAVVLHRGELQMLLLGAVAEPAVRTGATCTGFEEGPEDVRVWFSNGEVATGDLLVGADGLHSVIRAQLHGSQPPAYAGYTAWRGVTAFDLAPGEGGESWGRGQRFGIVPMSCGRVYWFAVANAPEGEEDPLPGRKARLLRRFRNWHAPIADVIAATEESAILRNDIYDRPPLKHWSSARVTLLGDAAHPTTPNLGQGACQAIEDAVVLGQCLGQGSGAAAALRQYDSARIPRTTRIVMTSRRFGQVAQMENPLLCRLRNALLRAIPARVAERQIAWVTHFPG